MRIAATVTQAQSRFAPILYTGELGPSLERLTAAGYAELELHLKDPAELDIDWLRGELEARQLRLASVGTGMAYVDEGLSFSSDEAGTRRRAVERIREIVDAFAWARPAIIIGTIKGRLADASSPEAARGRIAEALDTCAGFAAEAGTQLVLEAINRYEQDYLNSLGESAALIESIGRENIRIHADTFHMNIEEASITESLWRYRDYLGHIHFADNNRMPPGGGGLDFKAILRSLLRIDYRGAAGIECLPLPDGPTAAAQSLAYLNQLSGLID
jgi:sugar phosphate isomerase/epimerase